MIRVLTLAVTVLFLFRCAGSNSDRTEIYSDEYDIFVIDSMEFSGAGLPRLNGDSLNKGDYFLFNEESLVVLSSDGVNRGKYAVLTKDSVSLVLAMTDYTLEFEVNQINRGSLIIKSRFLSEYHNARFKEEYIDLLENGFLIWLHEVDSLM